MKQLLMLALVALVAVLAVLHLADYKDEQRAKEKNETRLFSLTTGDVNKITIDRIGLDEERVVVVFVKKNDMWWMEAPENYPASKYSIDTMLRDLLDLAPLRSFSPSQDATALDTYGLQKRTITVSVEGGGKTESLAYGEKNPVGENWFVQTTHKNKDKINIIKSGLEIQLLKSVKDYRIRDIFWAFPSPVTQIEIGYGDQNTAITRDVSQNTITEAEWYYQTGEDPTSKRAGKSQVDALLNGFRNLTATGFEVVTDLAFEQTIRIFTATENIKMMFHKKDDVYIGRIAGRPFDYRLPSYAVNQLFAAERKYVPRTKAQDNALQSVLENVKEAVQNSTP